MSDYDENEWEDFIPPIIDIGDWKVRIDTISAISPICHNPTLNVHYFVVIQLTGFQISVSNMLIQKLIPQYEEAIREWTGDMDYKYKPSQLPQNN